MASVANLGNDVVVAVGSTENNGVFRPAAWTRHGDGNWARVTSPSDVFRVTGSAQMRRVLRAGPGLVAVGYRTSLTGDKDGAIWVYDSGTRTWAPRRSPSLGGPGDQEVWSLASFHGNLFAVGTSDSEAGDSDAQVWTSSDGTFWSTVPGEPAHLDGTEVMKTVAATDNLLVAVGYEKEGSGDKDAAVWTSTDGKTWSPVLDLGVFGGPGDQEMIGVTTIDGNFVAVGYSKVGDQSIGVVWVSPDGRTWYRDKPPALQQTYVDIKSVSRVGDQLVAVGFVKDGTDKDAAAWLADVVGE